MKLFTHPAMIALGVATLCLLVVISPLVSATHPAIYHLSGSASTIFLAVFLNLLILWLLFTGLFLLAQRSPRARIFVWCTLTFTAPWVLLKTYAVLEGWMLPHKLSIGLLLGSIISLTILLASWRPSFTPLFENLQRFLATLLGFVALSAILIIVQLLGSAWQARALNQPRPLHRQPTASTASLPAKNRIIWLLLDELSYQQVYERRYPGLRLDAFDRLAAQSTIFTHAIPPADFTEIVVPSLISGIPADRIASSAAGQLSLHNSVTHTWRPFDPHQSVFQDALDAGYSTAIAGWFNPYCRILSPVLDHCFWSSHFYPAEDGIYADQSLATDLLSPASRLYRTTRSLLIGNPSHPPTDPPLHLADYRDLFVAADKLLADPSANFLFLHMPVPHPDGIYDRRTSTFTTTGNSSYIDNLALADQYLAHLRQTLEQRGEWDSSTIIVMGDHSWRTQLLWSSSPSWTPEDQAASHNGQFDNRPAYIVKLSGQHQPAHIDSAFPTLRTRALFDGIMDNRITTPEDLASWATQQQEPDRQQ